MQSAEDLKIDQNTSLRELLTPEAHNACCDVPPTPTPSRRPSSDVVDGEATGEEVFVKLEKAVLSKKICSLRKESA